MKGRDGTEIFALLLCLLAGMPAVAGHLIDVCATCHANATCDDKVDHSGKVCNCKYGFVGNGRTFCQDKDECQIGASKICGLHSSCHNTHGSYYCTCMQGFSPSNNMGNFIPNDGTHCQDVNECAIAGLCGEGGRCRNLEGGFDCSCELGYRVHHGAEPFNPHHDRASCKVVDCGLPVPPEDAVLLSVSSTSYGGVAMFDCVEGFLWRRGDNASLCGPDGLWKGAAIVCEEVDCGPPPKWPHSSLLWSRNSRMGSEVLYQCDSGYTNVGESNVLTCSADGQWVGASVLCQEILCGDPPIIESTAQVWDGNSAPGSAVIYYCIAGFYNKGGHNVSVCDESGSWTTPAISCQEISCGDPPALPHTERSWDGRSSSGSEVTYHCRKGFYHHKGDNVSRCEANGLWTLPSISCKEVNCGRPLDVAHAALLWNGASTLGSRVAYECDFGYRRVGGGNTSVCSVGGDWTWVSLLCQEITCQEPVFKPHAKILWDGMSHVGSVVHYQCDRGYRRRGLRDHSVCRGDGVWEESDLWCEEISCGPPLTLPNTNLLWDGSSAPGSVLLYECVEGFYQESGSGASMCLTQGEWAKVSVKCKAKCGPLPVLANAEVAWHNRSVAIHRCVDGYHSWRGGNVSVCGHSGLWQEATLQCIAKCGPLPVLANAEVAWHNRSVAIHRCVDGFYSWGGANVSVCGHSGLWQEATLQCMAECSSLPVLANAEVVWHNRSVAIHRCVDGYHSWRGGNVSVCGDSGLWQEATLQCIEIKPPINDLFVSGEKCLHWRAEKFEEDAEVYKLAYAGSRDYDATFRDKGRRRLSSRDERVALCLQLLPATNYSISITAVSARFTVSVTTNTSLTAPPAPVVYYREFETPTPTLRLHRSPHTLDAISLYQVFVLHTEGVVRFSCSSPLNPNPLSTRLPSIEYVAAQIRVRQIESVMNFTVGDGRRHGDFYNAPLENSRNYYIILRAVSQWKQDVKSSCVLWAKVKGTSYVLWVSSTCAFAVVGVLALAALGGYTYVWFKKT